MENFKRVIRLIRALGTKKRFLALTNPQNFGRIRAFCDKLIREAEMAALPKEFVISKCVGVREFALIPILNEGEAAVDWRTMDRRSWDKHACRDEGDGLFIEVYQDEIPPEFRGKIRLLFPGWREISNPLFSISLVWNNEKQRWARESLFIDREWGGGECFLRKINKLP